MKLGKKKDFTGKVSWSLKLEKQDPEPFCRFCKKEVKEGFFCPNDKMFSCMRKECLEKDNLRESHIAAYGKVVKSEKDKDTEMQTKQHEHSKVRVVKHLNILTTFIGGIF